MVSTNHAKALAFAGRREASASQRAVQALKKVLASAGIENQNE